MMKRRLAYKKLLVVAGARRLWIALGALDFVTGWPKGERPYIRLGWYP